MKVKIMAMRKNLIVLFYIVILLVTNGCASMTLWDHHSYGTPKKVAHAEVIQIFSAYEDVTIVGSQKRYRAKLAIQYKLNPNEFNAEKISLPELSEGFVILTDTDSLLNNLLFEDEQQKDAFILNIFERPEVNITSFSASKFYDTWNLTLYFCYKNNELWKNVLNSAINKSTVIPAYISSYKYPDSLKSNLSTIVTSPDAYDYQFRYRFFRRNTKVTYVKELDLKKWKPFLPNKKVPLPMSFYQIEPETIYKNSPLSRTILTPLSLAADAATFPLQLLFLLSWNYSGPR